MDNVYNWQFNCLPGSANQGAILMTRNDILRPPFTQDDFIWVAMEDVIGTADIRLTYNEKTNIYTLEKAIGHRNNDGSWIKDWYTVGSWERLSQEVADILRQLVYVEYRFDTSIPNVLKVVGVKKDLTEVVLCDISFVSLQEFNQAIATLDDKITAETVRATARENEIAEDLSEEVTRATARENEIAEDLEEEIVRAVTREFELTQMIEAATMNPGRAIEVTTDKVINVLIDNDSIKTNNSNQLEANVFDDTAVVNNKGWSSAKISQEVVGAMHYKGQVATYADLPTTGLSEGDLYNVVDTGDNYAWNGSSWDNMSGEYIAGAGINITGKVIKATGIAFSIGDGLETEGSGDNTMLKVKSNNDLTQTGKAPVVIDSNGGHIKVNTNQGLVHPSGANSGIAVRVRTPIKFVNGYVTLETEDGIQIKSNNTIGINTNFTIKDTPLGTDDSKLALYSDGKIGVDFTETPVILTGVLLIEIVATSDSQHEFINISIPNMNQYDMFRFEYGITNTINGTYSIAAGEYFSKSSTPVNQTLSVFGAQGGNTTSGYTGIQFGIATFENINYVNGTISKYSRWIYKNNTYAGTSGTWMRPVDSPNRRETIRIYGMKAK